MVIRKAISLRLFLLGLFGAALLLLSSCTRPKDLEFVDIQNIRMIKWGFSESQVGLDVRIYNPNNQSVKMKDAIARVYANSTYLGNSVFDSVINIPRRDTFSVPVVFNVNTATAISKFVETISDTAVTFRLEGSVKMGKAGVFVNYPFNVEQRMKTLEGFNTEKIFQ